MKPVRILTVGKAKAGHFGKAADHYRKLLSRFFRLEEDWVKDSSPRLSPEQRKEAEATSLLARHKPGEALICLDEKGKSMASRTFSAKLHNLVERHSGVCFVIGGPYGLGEEIRNKADMLLAFGPMTLPHEMARLVLLEQIYRAAAIRAGLPYHND
ncbi:MAG: 23S rRNA (pseudouridine(1915)-N(3))-methyltransferase RlmH [Desulfovibrio sp.]|uniref:23S rRNA (pseudouridine(1915)-N(3))-methyltransferase RlmH n=1 Tax=Desulfovibrio sp. 7SRBS1 TaxID=3378064 RepID=UPI003B3E0764